MPVMRSAAADAAKLQAEMQAAEARGGGTCRGGAADCGGKARDGEVGPAQAASPEKVRAAAAEREAAERAHD